MLVVTTWLPTREKPEIGTFVARDIESLSHDHDVHVLHLSGGGTTAPLVSEGVSVTTVPMAPANPLSIWRAARVIRRHASRADVVHTMAVSALLPFILFRPDVPWVHTEHWSALLSPSTTGIIPRAAIPVVLRLLAGPDVVIAVGRQLADAIGRRRKKPTVVIPNVVVQPPTLRPRPCAAETTLVGIGGLIPRKGPDVAIRAVAELRHRGIAARLVWAGDGPMHSELIALAEQLGIRDQVQLRGRVAPEHIDDLLAEGDAFLLPTTMETFGVAIAEALVAGRPVVVGAQGEQVSFVDEPDGVLVHKHTAQAYADGVQRVLAMNADRSVAEIAARTRARFDSVARRAEYAEVYARAGARRSMPDVDVIIAVHDPRRRIDRAVRSALSSESVARVIVVCHGIAAAAIESAAATDDPRVEFVFFDDGVRSPAGPFNHGLDVATGRFVAVVGSDDELTEGAVDAWRRTAHRTGAEVVIAPLRHAGGARVPTPPTLRARALRGTRDRLAYRTAPLGLLARERIGGYRLTPDLATGEDLAFTARLWFDATRVSRHTDRDEYLIHDGDDRITFTHRKLSDELRAVDLLIRDSWARTLSVQDRTAIAVKLWRITVFGAVHYRAGNWDVADRTWAARLVGALRDFAPQAIDRLSRADVALVSALGDPSVPDVEVDARSRERRRFTSVRALLPSRCVLLLAREAPVRFMAATWLARRR